MNQMIQRQISYRDYKITCFSRIKMHFYFFCKLCLSDRERKLNKIMKMAEGKLENALNMTVLIKNQRAFKALLPLILSRPSRKLLYYQRRETTVESKSKKKTKHLPKNQFTDFSSDSSLTSDYSKKKVKKVLAKVKSQAMDFDTHTNKLYQGVFDRNGLRQPALADSSSIAIDLGSPEQQQQ